MDSRFGSATFYDRRNVPASRRRMLIIPPLGVAVVLILLGLVIYHNIEVTLVGIGLAVAVALVSFYLEAQEEGPTEKAEVVLDRGDIISIALGLPALGVLAAGFLLSDGYVILIGFVLMVVFFVTMGLHDPRASRPESQRQPTETPAR